ncbi:MAG: phosphatase PAP2 family protein [Pseudomonadota bacterium]
MEKHMPIIKTYWFFIVTLIVTLGIWLIGANHFYFFKLNTLHVLLPDDLWIKINYITYSRSYILPALLIIITLLFKREKTLNVLLLIICYYVLFNYMKDFFHEARSYIQYDPATFYWLHPNDTGVSNAHRSFPSGHAGNAAIFFFTLSYFFAQHKLWLRTILIAALAFVMLARIATGWHFPLDVLASAIIGYVLTKIFLNLPLPNVFNFIPFIKNKNTHDKL